MNRPRDTGRARAVTAIAARERLRPNSDMWVSTGRRDARRQRPAGRLGSGAAFARTRRPAVTSASEGRGSCRRFCEHRSLWLPANKSDKGLSRCGKSPAAVAEETGRHTGPGDLKTAARESQAVLGRGPVGVPRGGTGRGRLVDSGGTSLRAARPSAPAPGRTRPGGRTRAAPCGGPGGRSSGRRWRSRPLNPGPAGKPRNPAVPRPPRGGGGARRRCHLGCPRGGRRRA